MRVKVIRAVQVSHCDSGSVSSSLALDFYQRLLPVSLTLDRDLVLKAGE